jgi:DNA transformation protein and related proteins
MDSTRPAAQMPAPERSGRPGSDVIRPVPGSADLRYRPGMSEPLTSIRNIGPAMAEALRRAGIETADDLRRLGTDAAYRRLLEAGARPHFIAYYVIEMGLQGRPWNDCTGAEKAALRRRFDALKATAWDPARSELEAALDALGIVDRRPQAGPDNAP